MAYTRLNPPIKVTSYSASGVTINGGANYYASFGGLAQMPGYEPMCAVFDLGGMSSFANLVAGAIQNNGTYIWARIYNSQSTACTGSWTAKVYWAPTQ
jgi:hypothetical protein